MIGVKRAAAVWRCDWAVILDSPALVQWESHLIGPPLLLTRKEYRPKYATLEGENVERLSRPWWTPTFAVYSATAALVLAHHLGATRVEVFGADWTNEPDFDDFVPAEMNRTETRWEREREVWRSLCDTLSERGTEVIRVPKCQASTTP